MIKLFKNKINLDFSDAEDCTADEVIELNASELLKDEVTPLKFVKWQDVQSITVSGERRRGKWRWGLFVYSGVVGW